MKRKMIKSITRVSCAIAVLLVISGCWNLNELPTANRYQGPAGTGSLSLTIDGIGRTIQPLTVQDDFEKYELLFTEETGLETFGPLNWDRNDLIDGTITGIPLGTWELTINASIDENDTEPAAVGTLEFTISATGQNVTGNVILYPIFDEGRGTFSWVLDYDGSNTDLAEATMSIYEHPIRLHAPNTPVAVVDLRSNWTGSETLDAGSYRVVFYLENNEGFYTQRSSMLHVYQSMNSPFPYTFRAVTFVYVKAWPQAPWGTPDLAYDKGANAIANGVSSWNPSAVVTRAFDGDNRDSDAATVWQAPGNLGAQAHWLAVDLGQEYDLGTVRITWGTGTNAPNPRVLDIMVNGGIWVASTEPDMIPNSYEDTGWIRVAGFANIGRGETTGNIAAPGGSWQNERTNTITIPAGTRGRYVRVKAEDPLNNAAHGAWTEYPRIASMEVYARGAPALPTPILVKEVTIDAPAYQTVPPAAGADFVTGDSAFSAELISISNAAGLFTGSVFAANTVYTYRITLTVTAENHRFTTAAPTVNGADAVIVSNNGYTMIVDYSFAATGTDIISAVALSNINQPVNGGTVPAAEGTYAAENALYTAVLAVMESDDGEDWENAGASFANGKYYTYIFTVTAKPGYTFNDGAITLSMIDNLFAGEVSAGLGTTSLTVAYEFGQLSNVITIAGGNITVTAPATGVAALALNSGNFADGDQFTAQLTSHGGVLADSNYRGGVAYAFEFTLTAAADYIFADAVIPFMVNNLPAHYTFIDEDTAAVYYTFPILDYLPDSRAKDWVYNLATTPQLVSNPGANTGSAANPFNGEPTNMYQTTGPTGTTNPQWIAIDMGQAVAMGTIRITWDNPADGAANGMMHNYDVQINTSDAPSITGWGDDGWESIVNIRRERPATLAESKALYGVDIVTIPFGTNAQWIRLKRADGSSTSNNREYSDWIRLYGLEVYSEGAPIPLTAITTKAVTDITVPAALATPPEPGDTIATGDNFTVALISITGGLTSEDQFAYDTAYTYEMKLIANEDYRFSTAWPTVMGAAVTGDNQIAMDSYEIVVRHTFARTSPPPAEDGFAVYFTNEGIIDDSVNSGLTATATTALAEYDAGTMVQVKIEVTGTAKKASIYTAALESAQVTHFTFIPGASTGSGTSSSTQSRNIGGRGYAAVTTGNNSGDVSYEAIGAATYGDTVTQSYDSWTFFLEFEMPEEDVTLSLKNTFRSDIAAAIVAADGTSVVRASGYQGAHEPANVFSGVYQWTAQGTYNDRWQSANGATNSWIIIDLGAEYIITDAVLRWHSNNGTPRDGFRIDVSNNSAVWDAPQAWGDFAEGLTAGTDTENGWRTAWTLTRTGTAANATYHAFFHGDDGSATDLLKSSLGGGIAPWTATPVTTGTPHNVSITPLIGRYVKLHTGGQPVNAGVGLGLWNFEIYGQLLDD
ncbi:MAG: discoidin domain-containing protein [Treponema sp.]|nr:discoidin domain-containing protein [Treponema sp.]